MVTLTPPSPTTGEGVKRTVVPDWVPSILAGEGPDSGEEEYGADCADEDGVFEDAHAVAEEGDAEGEGVGRVGERADHLGAEEHLADGVDSVGERVDLGDHLEPRGDPVDWEERRRTGK